ncbi:MAG: hypothetical protein Q8Q49_06085 [bacterium]|nr:hypothetical protein [bacterium]
MPEVAVPPQTTQQNTPPPVPIGKRKGKRLLLLLVVCLIVLAGAIVLNVFQKPLPKNEPTQTVQSLFLNIDHPKDQDSAINGELLVSGKTLPHATVLIFTDSDDTSVESDDQGAFEGTVLLGSGESVVRVTAYDGNGNEKTQTLSVSPES